MAGIDRSLFARAKCNVKNCKKYYRPLGLFFYVKLSLAKIRKILYL